MRVVKSKSFWSGVCWMTTGGLMFLYTGIHQLFDHRWMVGAFGVLLGIAYLIEARRELRQTKAKAQVTR